MAPARNLRGSTGGLYEQAIAAADIFLPAGGALIMYARHGDKSKLDSTKDDPVECETPLIVLVDGATAVGSEMFAAVLQERGRAVLMGSRTWGAGHSLSRGARRTCGASGHEYNRHPRQQQKPPCHLVAFTGVTFRASAPFLMP